MDLAQAIKTQALTLGFDRVGITSAEPIDPRHRNALRQWIEKGYAADLTYMRKNVEKRPHPARLLHGAQSVICTALHYKPPPQPHTPEAVKIAAFALHEDYHPFLKERLRRLAHFIHTHLPAGFRWRYKICVDTAPIAERALAARAGLGFIGKNHMLIHPALGSHLLLGLLVTTLPLPPDEPMKVDPCRDCSLCLRACPTGALRPDGFFDARRCISYLTQYPSDGSQWTPAVGNRLFGCDVCLLACPYEKQAPTCKKSDFRFFPERCRLDPVRILHWNEHQFKEHFENSCIREIGLEKLKENARICISNRNTNID